MSLKRPAARPLVVAARNAPGKVPAATLRSKVLTKATVRVADRLGLGQAELAGIIGVSPSTASRMFTGGWVIQEETKNWELAALLVRVFRSLDALVGGNEKQVKQWFQAMNTHLGGAPRQLIASVEGLTNVARYLDAMRGAQ
ncbi:MAG TPA: XRE family transcriptional regulator [Polyangia bacterium]|jgi:DNA-binding XRE family transcriptional regulator